jgi:spore maturation protein CgeB
MTAAISLLLADRARAATQAERGLATVRRRHTCAHRVDELLAIHDSLRDPSRAAAGTA